MKTTKLIYEAPLAKIVCKLPEGAICQTSVGTEDFDTPEDFVW